MKKSVKFLSIFLSLGLVVSLITPFSLAAGFSDTRGHWARQYIDEGVQAGYISGYSDGTFRPDDSVTRGAFCKILNNALDLQTTTDLSFSDVKPSNTFYSEIQKAVYAGYISGYTDDTFRPGSTITRQEAAVMLSRVISSPSSKKNLDTLADSSSISSYARDGVAAVYSKGYIEGDKNHRFRPGGNLTRGQTAKIVSTLLDGERVVRSNTTFTTSGKTYSNNIYTGQTTISLPASGSIEFSNCKLLGKVTVAGGGSIGLTNSRINNLIVSSGSPTVTASGSSIVNSTALAGGASLTESGLTGDGFKNVSLKGSALKSAAVNLRGDFSSVSVFSPSALNLLSGSISALKVVNGSGGSSFTLSSGTKVASAMINAACAFKGTGVISSAVQNVANVTYETVPVSLSGSAGLTGTLVATMNPANGATNISLNSSITLTFGETVYTANHNNVDSSYLKSTVLEIRSGSASGSLVGFSVTVDSSRRTVTLFPTYPLSAGTTYYIVIKAVTLSDSSGEFNTRQVFSFTTTGVTLVPTLGRTSNVPINSDITLTFREAVYDAAQSGYSTPGSSVLSNAFRLYKGSASGKAVTLYAPTISNGNRTITLNPRYDLDPGTKYTVVLYADYLKNSSGETNGYQTFSFTTAGSLLPTVSMSSPSSGAVNVSPSTSITLEFSEQMYNTAWSSLSAADITNSTIRLYTGSTSVSYSATVVTSNSRTKVTLVPTSPLSENTTYFVGVSGNRFRNAGNSYVAATVFSFKTSAPTVTVSKGSVGPAQLTVNFSSTISGTATITLNSGSAQTVSNVTAGQSYPVTFSDLAPNTEYMVSVTVSSGDKLASGSLKVSTPEPSIQLTPTIGQTTIALTGTYDYPGTLTITYGPTGGTQGSLYGPAIMTESSGTLSGIPLIADLTPNTRYTVTAIYLYGSKGQQVQKTYEYTTLPVSEDSSLNSFTVQVNSGTLSYGFDSPASISAVSDNIINGIPAASGDTLQIAVTAADKSTVTINTGSGDQTGTTASITVDAESTETVMVTVTAENGSAKTYTFLLNLISPVSV